jgi:hypothetical protein
MRKVISTVLLAITMIGDLTAQTNVAPFKVTGGPTTQATNGLGTVTPTRIDIEEGSTSSPLATGYQTRPGLYISRVSGTTNGSNCIVGLVDGCIDPLVRIDGTNANTGTIATQTGVVINLGGYKAATQLAAGACGSGNKSACGNQAIGAAFGVWDSTTANLVALNGINPNVGVQSVPLTCVHVGGSPVCARTVNAIELDVTSTLATAGVFENGSTVGNLISGMSVLYFNTNGAPADATHGLLLDTGTVGVGWQIAAIFGGAKNIGLLIPQTHITNAPSIAALHLATQGSYGAIFGTGSTTYSHGAGVTLANPSIAAILLDVSRLEGSAIAANSNKLMYRTSPGATTYYNWQSYYDSGALFHWQSDRSGSFADMMTYQTAAVPANGGLIVTGQIIATSAIQFRSSGGNLFQFNGTPTGSRTLTFQDASYVVIGRDTTDTLTGKTYDTAGSGNILKINGTTVNAVSGSNNTLLLATSPSMTTPTISGAALYIAQTIGVGNAANANLQAPAHGTGSGPATLTAVQWQQISINGANYWIPLYQ